MGENCRMNCKVFLNTCKVFLWCLWSLYVIQNLTKGNKKDSTKSIQYPNHNNKLGLINLQNYDDSKLP